MSHLLSFNPFLSTAVSPTNRPPLLFDHTNKGHNWFSVLLSIIHFVLLYSLILIWLIWLPQTGFRSTTSTKSVTLSSCSWFFWLLEISSGSTFSFLAITVSKWKHLWLQNCFSHLSCYRCQRVFAAHHTWSSLFLGRRFPLVQTINPQCWRCSNLQIKLMLAFQLKLSALLHFFKNAKLLYLFIHFLFFPNEFWEPYCIDLKTLFYAILLNIMGSLSKLFL